MSSGRDIPQGGDEVPSRGEEHCGEAALYLLGLLDTRQTAAFLTHASACAVCRDEIDALRPAVDILPVTVPLVAAPEHVKQRVMSVVREEAHSRVRPVASERPSQRLSRRRVAPALVFAALLAAALAIALSAPFGGGTSRVVSAEVTLRGASAALHRSGGQAWLTVTGMPEPSAGHVYEVWVKRPGYSLPQPTTGLFAPNSDGAGAVYVPGGLSGVSEVLVTQEPAGGSRVPTSAPVVIARVS
ncbi:MAG TPA: anti-sigma factor [Solirubrobacteraceae bacterium]|nr:anti-sigma factor [Solirubrobacteraceae bacterium]